MRKRHAAVLPRPADFTTCLSRNLAIELRNFEGNVFSEAAQELLHPPGIQLASKDRAQLADSRRPRL
jgi:hypothetical protein